MLIYLILPGFVFLLALLFGQTKLSSRVQLVGIIAVSFVLAVFSGFMDPTIGRDRPSYVLLYDSLPDDSGGFGWGKDIGYYFLSTLFKVHLGWSHQWFFFFVGFFSLSTIFIVIWRLSLSPIYSIFLYISEFFYIQCMTQLRVQLAVTFLFVAVYLLLKKRHVWSLVFFFIGVSFQYSSAIFILAYFANGFRPKILILFMVFCLCFSVFGEAFLVGQLRKVGSDYFDQRLLGYLGLASAGDDVSLSLFKFNILAKILLIVLLARKRGMAPAGDLFLKVQVLSVATFWLFHFSGVIASRFSEVFGVFEVFLIPYLFARFRRSVLTRTAILLYGAAVTVNLVFVTQLFGEYSMAFD